MHVARRIAIATAIAGAFALPARAGVAQAVGATCVPETYQWAGEVVVEPGASVSTGVSVPAQAGTDLVVVGTSADAVDAQGFATALGVTIGGTSATAGASVSGGEILLHHGSGSAPLTVHGAAVTVQRCTTVAQEPPPVVAAGAGSGTTGSGGSDAGALPSAGADVGAITTVAAAAVLAGAAGWCVGRRRTTA